MNFLKGKDKDMSKDDLIHENDKLVAEVSRLKLGLDEVHEMFQNLEKAFVESKASFSLGRYGELKDMIKNVISDETMKKVHSLTENQVDGGKKGLLQKAKELAGSGDGAGAAAAAAEEPNSPPPPRSGGFSGFLRKIKDVTGFSTDDPLDIRCLDKDDIRQDNERKKRDIQRLNARALRAYSRLEQLHKRYQSSKSYAPPTRYQELKDMIKDILADDKL